MVKRTQAGQPDIVMIYDADGNRVSKSVGGTVTTYLVDDRNPTGYAQVLEECAYTGPEANALAAYWSLDGTAVDDSGNGNNGLIVNGPSWTSGRIGSGALDFSGNNYLTVENSAGLEVGASGADFSVSFWLNLQAGHDGSWRNLMHKGNSDSERTFALWMYPTTDQLYYRISTTAAWEEGGLSVNAIPLNQWVEVTYVKAGSQLQLYLNGTLDSQVTLEGASVANTGPIYFGKDPWYEGTDCQLDDIRIYNRALSASEIAGLVGNRTTYVYGLSLISQTTGGGTTYYGYDGLGSVRYLTDNTGNVTDTYTYDAFGIQIAGTGTTANNYRYTGQQWDADLGMYYLRARYYKPETGRFWTSDSYESSNEDPAALHKYAYAHSNPANYVDPSGHLLEGPLIEVTEEMMEKTGESTYANASYEAMERSLVFKVGAWAIIGGVVAQNLAMVLDDVLPEPQQESFEKYKNREFGEQYKCVAYANYFHQDYPKAGFVAFRMKENQFDVAPFNAIMARSGALFNTDPQTAISNNGFHMGAMLENLVFDNNSLGLPLSLWGENYYMAQWPDEKSECSMNEAVRKGFGEMRVYDNWEDVPHSRHNFDGKWNRGRTVSF